jgi:hypothetical protein
MLTLHRNTSVQQDQQDALIVFCLLRLTASTCFKHLFAHHQEALYIQQLVYFVHIMSADCYQGSTPTMLAGNRHNTHKIYQFVYIQCLVMMSK